jgi:GT2 family glycosyltransferase
MGVELAIIINSFNRFTLLKESLTTLSPALRKSELDKRSIVVVYEAGSTDGSLEWLKKEGQALDISIDIIIPEQGDETSFATGVNSATEYALKKYPCLSYLLFYETDNQILEPEPLLNARAQLEEKKLLAACGFTVRKHNGSPAGVGQPFPKLLNFVFGNYIVNRFKLEAISYKWQTNTNGVQFSEVDVVYTSPLLVRVTAWKESGGLDAKSFPFSDCDVDWARRLRMLGFKMGVIRSDAVIHDNKNILSNWSKARSLQIHRARLKYFRLYNPVGVFLVWPFLLLFRHSLELIGASVAVRDSNRRNRLMKQYLHLFLHSLKGYKN